MDVKPGVIVEIGKVPVRLSTADPAFLEMIGGRYAGFVTARPSTDPFELVLTLTGRRVSEADDVRVTRCNGCWRLERGDFYAEWSPETGRGWIRQARPNPYSIDAVLRIVHTLLLARQGGFLLHAASAIRNGRAVVFSGVSGAGKTTVSRLAPPDVTLLSDEISYIRPDESGYRAFGTPFAGELGTSGENVSAPIRSVYLLAHGDENKCEPVRQREAAAALLRNILFFAEDADLVGLVFRTACKFVTRVPVYRLHFTPDSRVWEALL